jgi:hypothetical protein
MMQETRSRVNSTVVIHSLTTALAFGFAALVADQWIRRRQPYQLVWAFGLVWYGIGAGSRAPRRDGRLERHDLYRGLVPHRRGVGRGLARPRHDLPARPDPVRLRVAGSLLLAGLFTYLTQQRYDYANAGVAPVLYALLALAAAVAIAWLSWRRSSAWAHVAGGVIVAGTIVSAVMMAALPLPAPGYALDPATGAPTGELFPGYLRLLTPFFNITGAFALVFGAIYSAYVFMPKRRVITYSVRADQRIGERIGALLLAPIAIAVNLVASLPGCGRRPRARPPEQPGPGHASHRRRRHGRVGDERPGALRRDERARDRPPRRAAPHLPRLPREHRGLQRRSPAVHPHRASPTGRRRADRRLIRFTDRRGAGPGLVDRSAGQTVESRDSPPWPRSLFQRGRRRR